MTDYSVEGKSLPCPADRQKILENANLVLAEARVIAKQAQRNLTHSPELAPGKS